MGAPVAGLDPDFVPLPRLDMKDPATLADLLRFTIEQAEGRGFVTTPAGPVPLQAILTAAAAKLAALAALVAPTTPPAWADQGDAPPTAFAFLDGPPRSCATCTDRSRFHHDPENPSLSLPWCGKADRATRTSSLDRFPSVPPPWCPRRRDPAPLPPPTAFGSTLAGWGSGS